MGENGEEPSALQHNKNHSREDKQNAHREGDGKLLGEDEDANKDGCERLEGAQDGRGGAADIFGSIDHQHQRHDGRNNGQPTDIEPPSKGVGDSKRLTRQKSIGKHPNRTIEEDIEIDFEGGHDEISPVDYNNIQGIGQRGKKHQNHPDNGQSGGAVAPIKKSHPDEGEHYGKDGDPIELFVEEDSHDNGSHDRIGEEYCGGDTGIHESETEVECERGDNEKQPQKR